MGSEPDVCTETRLTNDTLPPFVDSWSASVGSHSMHRWFESDGGSIHTM